MAHRGSFLNAETVDSHGTEESDNVAHHHDSEGGRTAVRKDDTRDTSIVIRDEKGASKEAQEW